MTLTTTSFTWVCDLVRRESAIVLAPGKEYLVEARLLPVARSLGHPGVVEFVDALRARTDREAVRRVVEALTTNETSWFRDGDPFSALATTVLPQLLSSRAPGEPLRVWSAASSSGQEPYTLAMILTDALAGATQRVQITATDLSSEMVERTKAGKFSQLEVNRGLPAPMMVRHFTRAGNDWQVAQPLRAMVTASECNLAAPLTVSGPFDVVFLRNVLIYFDTATKQDILRKVRKVMKPDGWLFLGAAETTLGIDDTWDRVVLGRSSAYRPTAGLGGGTPAQAARPVSAATATGATIPAARAAVTAAGAPAGSAAAGLAARAAAARAAAPVGSAAAGLAARAAAAPAGSAAAGLAARAAAARAAAPVAGAPAGSAAAGLAARAAATARAGAAPPGSAAAGLAARAAASAPPPSAAQAASQAAAQTAAAQALAARSAAARTAPPAPAPARKVF